ncbi:MAG: hypothetical protein U0359_29405 [Byssovorax sp.]
MLGDRAEGGRGDLLAEEEDAHREDEPGEAAAERGRREVARKACAAEAARDGRARDDGGERPVEVDMAGVPRERPGERLERDDEERGPDRLGHGEAAEEGERRDDEEAAARADEAGDDADAEPDADGLGDRGLAPDAALAPGPHHRDGRGEHHRPEADEEQDGRQEVRDLAAREGARHARCAEDEAGPEADPPGARVGDDAGGAGRADHEERHGDGGLRLDVEHVDEDREGEDGTAASEEAEAEADEEREEGGDDQHGRPRLLQRSCQLSQVG